MMPASRGVAVAYSVLLESSPAPIHEAHDAFRTRFAETPRPARELTASEKRERLRAQMRAAGTDATLRALAGETT